MLDPLQFRRHVIRPSLIALGLHTPAAEALLLGTALVESGLRALIQRGGGPALGLYQIEPATHADVWRTYLAFRPPLAARVRALSAPGLALEAQLVGNLGYATAIARVIYLRRPQALPAADDLDGLARYWKAHFNTAAGKGNPAHFAERLRPYLHDPETRSTA